MKKSKIFLTIWIPTLLSLSLYARQSECPQFYLKEAPDVNDSIKHVEMCQLGYSLYWNETTKNAFYSAEMLLSTNLKTIPRDAQFYKNPILNSAVTEDYINSGYDRGHLTPSADANTSISQKQTFDLANVAPQNPVANRVLWKKLESDVREQVKSNPGVKFYIITGVYGSLGSIKGSTNIPMWYYKIVVNSKTKKTTVYRLKNNGTSSMEIINIELLEKETGIKFHL